jgi:hypothetical protein
VRGRDCEAWISMREEREDGEGEEVGGRVTAGLCSNRSRVERTHSKPFLYHGYLRCVDVDE